MATITWPIILPQLFLDGSYVEALRENVIRDQFDMGPAGLRRRATAAPFNVAGRMMMTTVQWEAFSAFCADVLLERSLAFGIPVQSDCDSPVDEWLVRILEPPARQPKDMDWEVTLKLEVLP